MDSIQSRYDKKVLIVLICGIPGVGKTYLTDKLFNHFTSKYDVYKAFNLNFDETFIKESYDKSADKFDLLKYKQARNKFFDNFKNLIKEINEFPKGTFIIFLDDNFYFKSMRKPFYKYCLNQM